MSMDAKAREKAFQDYIIQALLKQGWLLGDSAHYDRERALYPEDVFAYVQQSQPEAWDKYAKIYPQETEKYLLNAVVRHLDHADKGTLWLLRNHLEDRGARLRLATFMPDHGLNPELLSRYHANRLRVVPELVYSPNGYDGRLDLTLFVNGLPVATLELKSCFKQSLENAKQQYRKDRQVKTGNKDEPLLKFRRGALVHFAVNQFEVAMTTKLAGENTYFLPFNKGTKAGGAGNEQPENGQGFATEYLWGEIFSPDNWLRILGRYIHLEVKREEDALGRVTKKETMIFPRYHQWHVVQKLLSQVEQEGTGQKYLIQHSAGSGKSNSIAWLTHQLASLYDHDGNKIFKSVIVITDRTVLDSQLQETISQFEHAEGVISRINRDEGDGSKSAQLAASLTSGTPIIVVTIQTFPYVLKAIQEATSLKDCTFAVIADEAHSSQSGSTARQLREVLMAEQLEDNEELSAEDVMNMTLAARGGSKNISYFAFTATPKGKTLELFGRPENPMMPLSDDNKPKPFDVYSMRQAIEENYILDVLRNYTSYSLAYRMAMAGGNAEQEVDSKKAKKTLNRWMRLHPHNIGQKVQVIVEHFKANVAHLLNHQAKAMVVTSSRLEAVKYKLAFDKYVKEQGYHQIKAMVAFSGEVIDPETAVGHTERSMNPDLNGQDMRKAFDTDGYQLMLVANKFQTGFDQPKLCAMYVDKKLTGVDCIQTLSRLNRTYPGKDRTFVLDFVNEPQEVLEEFQKYYETAELETVSDPNLVYDLKHKLVNEGIFLWSEVEAFATCYFDPKRGTDYMLHYLAPARDRFRKRYLLATDALRTAKQQLKQIKQAGTDVDKANAEKRVAEAEEARNQLVMFKKDLNSYIRFYEFASQITQFDAIDLEQLSTFAKHLLPLLREEALEDDEIDLDGLVLSHYQLKEKRTQDLELREGRGEGLDGITGLGSATPKKDKKDFLSEILVKMNELFGEGITDGDKLDWLHGMASKIAEDKVVMDQIHNNDRKSIMQGDFPKAADQAVIERMDIQHGMSMDYLARPEAAKAIQNILLDILLKGLGREVRS
ncbi:type I restriction endonuclease subunit R [Shewanella sp. SM32]|uniref:type I restriction endonuclease subunit R n=1 Tax=Shewanella sp. SM32 TaxID=2912796 RepID=UPI0021DABBFE|nr:DEAD/DEAH box helicase family protein [Shewanella sp. SM32]MCU8070482.1 DEAD/DEAH box helicase family protein [Shewanella sp. SM32]